MEKFNIFKIATILFILIIIGSTLLVLFSTACTSPQKYSTKQELQEEMDTEMISYYSNRIDYNDIYYIADYRVHKCFAIHPLYGMSVVECTQEITELLINKR